MDLITLDFETKYGDGYTLSSMTTEAYVRDKRFEAILCSFKINDQPSFFVPRDSIASTMRRLELHKHAVIMHHAHFDALIASVHYNERPRLIIDTLGMARALHGANGRLSLEKLAERYGIGQKGKEVHNVRGMSYADFSSDALQRYGIYSCNDSDLTYQLAIRMLPHFSREELEINDAVIRMFTEPVFHLDPVMLRRYADQLRADKVSLMMQAGVQVDELMSNDKFAACLQELGVDPPMKISPAWQKKAIADRVGNGLTYAFAKTDMAMQALQEHPDERVQILVEARLKNKTTIAEKGAERLIDMATRGAATVYLKYSGASGTHRLSGGDKFNWQAMKRGSDIRNAVMAPPGYKVVVGDSSNIEARMLDWLAGQDDMVQVYRDADAKIGPDMYCVIGEKVYGYPINKIDFPDERQFGKVVKLGLGFGMGSAKFVFAVRGQAKGKDGKPLVITQKFSNDVVEIYRNAHPQVRKLWKRGEDALDAILHGRVGLDVDYRGVVRTCDGGLLMPGGLKILYPDLQFEKDKTRGWGGEYTFWNGKMREHIYGPKVIENIIQCLARIVVFDQCRLTAKALKGIARWAHSVHDEGVFVAPDFYAPYAQETLQLHMRVSPSWAPDLPLNSEGGFHQRYGMAKT